MTRRNATVLCRSMVTGALAASLICVPLLAQRATPADVAARLTGTWQMNMDLSPQFRPASSGRQGAAGVAGAPLLAAANTPRTSLGFQRGGGRGGGGGGTPAPPDPRIIAGNRAIQSFQQAAPALTIAATADSVTFTDARGTRTYDITNKNVRVDVGDEAVLTTKTRWDSNTLRQEFIFDETKVSHAFEVNDDGTRMTFTMRVDNFSGGVGRQVRGIYDKK